MAHPQKRDSTCHSSSLFNSPTFRFFTSKMAPFDSDFPLISPTSILEANPSIFSSKATTKPMSSYFEPTIPDPKRFHTSTAFGLADLVKNRDHSKKPVNKMVLFGSKLRVQIPSTDFGTKTGVAAGIRYPGQGHGQVGSVCVQTKVLTESETEEYTRVISHGPNPTITHILDNSVFVEATPCLPLLLTNNSPDNFLCYCYTCKKNLDQKQDIFIYRGDQGFCSSDCRYQEMLLDQMET